MLADPVLSALGLALLFVAARFGGRLAQRLGQPRVLGELLAGVALGQLRLLDEIANDQALALVGEIGVALLLFEVGLESTVGQMLAVGAPSLRVALLGVLTPFGLGYATSAWLSPDASSYTHAFMGAVLTATSVGITARVLRELDKSTSEEARIILGAAVIDDVLGLMILAITTSIIVAADSGNAVSVGAISVTILRALGFLVVAVLIGPRIAPRIFGLASRSRALLLLAGLAFCLALSWAALALGLAAIVGAFVAGLVLEPTHYSAAAAKEGEDALLMLLRPLVAFLAPIFFVRTGMHTQLSALAQPGALELAGALTLAAVLGKQACFFGATDRRLDRLSIALGMIPRGEVGLVFANVGLSLQLGGQPVIDAKLYAAVVLMVLITTLITPPLLKWSLSRVRTRDVPI